MTAPFCLALFAGATVAVMAWISTGIWREVRWRAQIAWTPDERRRVASHLSRTGVSITIALVSWLAGSALTDNGILQAFASAFAAALPWLAEREARERRRRLARRALPDFLELLGLACSSGLTLRQSWEAALDVCPEGPLREAASRCGRDLRSGRPWSEALPGMNEALGERRFDAVGALIRQAAERGAPLADVVFQQAAVFRADAMLAAEERAQTAPLRMLFPLVFLIFPAIFLILLGPVFLSIAKEGRIF